MKRATNQRVVLDTEAWRDEITPAFALDVLAVAGEVVSTHPEDSRTPVELAGDLIDSAYSWAAPSRRQSNPEAWEIGRQIMRMVDREGIDPLCGPPT